MTKPRSKKGSKPPNQPRKPKKWSMWPSLNQAVQDLLADDDLAYDFNNEDDDESCSRSYDTNIMGRFRCFKPQCDHKWSSKKIAITIRLYDGNTYNARVYHQRCDKCKWTCKPKLDESYAERVAYRLKRWSGVQVEAPFFGGESTAPHRRDLCEGCKAGHCEAGM